ncbi:MAG: helix-turn-helix domain-containing protein [Deltaproteobacteria bacterium]|nr:helix-turn-helix domain-containing protein [Deltaproteobacteria bacterium]
MTEIGTWLRQAREAAGITLDQVAAQTKVRGGLLADLEANRLQRLPQRVFVRGFVRSYAEAVGAPVGEALEVLEHHYGISEGRIDEVFTQAQPVLERQAGSGRPRLALALVLLVALLTFAVAWAVQHSGSPRKAASAAVKTDVDSGTAGTLADPNGRR